MHIEATKLYTETVATFTSYSTLGALPYIAAIQVKVLKVLAKNLTVLHCG